DPFRQGLQAVPSTRREHQLGTPLGERHRRRLADPRRGAGDDDHLASQLHRTSLAYADTQCLPTLSKPTSAVCHLSRRTSGSPAHARAASPSCLPRGIRRGSPFSITSSRSSWPGEEPGSSSSERGCDGATPVSITTGRSSTTTVSRCSATDVCLVTRTSPTR